jgi:MFS superfamily sulfate permease-like transporter
VKRARALPLFRELAGVTRAAAVRDALGGFTLAAMSVPQVLGYTRIAGTPVVTGVYTLLLPLVDSLHEALATIRGEQPHRSGAD